MIRPQFTLDLNSELIVDNFAGGGGASTGIEMALGRHVDLAINHDRQALAMHEANHPQTRHLPEDIWAVDPVKETNGRPVGLLWLSPDCKHFSKAKGGKPREKKIRGLALIGLNWVRKKRPRVMILENVEEFQSWGPLLRDGTLNPRRKGKTFLAYVGWLRRRGYAVEWRELRACDYGAPTIRKRLFLIARCDGVPITWPEPTHGAPASVGVQSGKLKPWRTAAECIDWSIPCPSIFERARPLAEATCRRIAKGIMRYVVNCADPFIVPLTHRDPSDRVTTMGQPLPTVTGANRGELALVAPAMAVNTTGHPGGPAAAPLHTVCAEGTHHMLVAPVLAETAHGEISPRGVKRWGSGAQSAERPLNTVAASGGNAALVGAFLAKHYGGVVGSEMSDPTGTVTAKDHHSVVTASLVGVGGRAGQSRPRGANEPTATLTSKADSALVSAHLTKFRTGSTGSDLGEPVHTITAGPKENPAGAPHAMGLVAANLVRQFGTSNAADVKKPIPTVMADGGGKTQLVEAFLIKYYGTDQDPQLREPLHTVTARDRFGLVMVNGEEYVITDIGLRMLAPRELFRAQGFPDSYIIGDRPEQGLTLTKSAQVRMCGNSVCPPLAEALVRANVPEMSVWFKNERKTA